MILRTLLLCLILIPELLSAQLAGTVVVYRTQQFASSLNPSSVYLDGSKVAVMKNNSRLDIQITQEGSHEFSAKWAGRLEKFRKNSAKTATLQGGNTVYFKIDGAALSAANTFIPVEESVALSELAPIPNDRYQIVSDNGIAVEKIKANPVLAAVEPPLEKAEGPKTRTETASKTVESSQSPTLIKSTGVNYALIIGVDDYQDAQIVDLDKPVADAQTLYAALTEKYTFEVQHVKFLKNPSRSDITQALDRYSKVVTDKDNLLIFYAGHGHWDEKFQQGYWLTSDADHKNRGSWLSNGTLRDYMRGIEAKHSLLITDACFGGGIFKSRAAFSDAPMAINQLYDLPSRKAMTSGALSEVHTVG